MEANLSMSEHMRKPLLTGPVAYPLRVASIGECMVEMAPGDDVGLFRQSFAGDTFNTLWYLRQLAPDWAARYVSRVGDDRISDEMLAMMEGAGVETSHVGRDASRTVGLYLISLKDGERSFAYWRSQSAARLLAQDAEGFATALQDANIIFFSGITLAILDATAREAVLAMLSAERRAGKTIVFDPNLRPRLWSDAASMRDAIMAGAAASDIVLPSFDEEAEQFGDATAGDTAARYLSAGAATVVVKNGPGAVHFVHRGQSGTVTPDPVPKVVDTTSAGDSFNAGLLVGLGRFEAPEDAIRFAAGVAAQVIGQKGALGTLDLGVLLGT